MGKRKEKFAVHKANIEKAFGVDDASELFSVAEPQALKLIDAVKEKNDFLKRVSILYVTDIKGDIVTLDVTDANTGRSNVDAGKERKAKRVGDLSGRKYECIETTSDLALSYKMQDAWSRYPDFSKRWANLTNTARAADWIKIGFNGKSRAVDTDAEINPLRQDVNIGWLERMRLEKPEHVINEGKDAGKLTVGVGGDLRNVDQLAFNLLSIIPEEKRTGNEVVIMGTTLLNDRNEFLISQGNSAQEINALASMAHTYVGTMQVVKCPFFPVNAMLVCDPKKLQIYLQADSLRKFLIDEPKLNQTSDFLSYNQDFQIETLDSVAIAENVEFIGQTA